MSVVIFLLTLELLLRLNGAVDMAFQSWQNHQKISGGRQYVIMCIGDSNTYLGGENSYPSQLEKILNSRVSGNRFKVVNQGLPAAPSKVIMDAFEPWLSKYSPDMVVSMMGANDRHSPQAEQAKEESKFLAALKTLKLYKMLAGMAHDVHQHVLAWLPQKKQPAPPSPFKVVPPKYVQMFYMAMDAKGQGRCDIAEYFFTKLLTVPDLEITFQQRVDSELRQCYEAQHKYDQLMDALRFNFNIWEFDVGATNTVQDLCRERRAEPQVLGLLNYMVAQKTDSIAFNGMLGACYAQYGHMELAKQYLAKVEQIRGSGDVAILKEDYLKLHRILKEHKVKGVYVQYPLRSVDELRRIFKGQDDYDKIILVDNEAPFKEALDPQKYGLYFTDRNYDDIGHCTALGNRILAGDIADAILKYLHF